MKLFKLRFVIILSIGILSLFAAAIAIRQIVTIQYWHNEHRAIEAMIHALRPRVPIECSEDGWRMAVHRTEVAFDNIAYDLTYVSQNELKQLRVDLETILSQRSPSPSLLFEIYNRIGRCNKITAEKSDKWRADVTEFIERSYKITARKKQNGVRQSGIRSL